ncbi:hypothetical protein ACQ4PT_004451 [Festuca glaucescens]
MQSAITFVFTAGEHGGSTLGMLGTIQSFESAFERAVVGGTGAFRMARGYCVMNAVSNPTLESVVYEKAAPLTGLPRGGRDGAGAPAPRSWAAGPCASTPRSATPSPTSASAVSTCAGVDSIDLAEFARRGIAFANSGEVFSTDVTDAVGLLLHVLRQVSTAGRYVQHGSWPVQGDYRLGSKVL